MREVLRNLEKRDRKETRSYPERVVITHVPGCEYSEVPELYKATVTYRRVSGERVKKTRRFVTVKQARYWAKMTLRGQKGRNGW